MTKEALKLALEALEGQCRLVSQTRHRLVGPAITAIKEVLNGCQCPECKVVLHASDCAVHNEPAYPKGQCNCGAQPEQEPVAWRYKILDYFGRPVWTFKTPKTDIRVFESQPLYTSPPQRTWVRLTDEEREEIALEVPIDAVSITEAKLKEKNA